jgi:hypothetical protein
MGKNPAQLSQKQVDVLGWIGDGCPDGVYVDGYEHRIVARALERRGLVTITGRGESWRAVIIEAGRTRQAAPPAPVLPPESDADVLIDRVLAAGGRLLLEDDPAVEAEHERLVAMSLKSARRPHGKKLEMRRTGRYGSGPREIVIVEHFDDYVQAAPVPVPTHVTRFHPVVRAYIANKDAQFVTKEHLARAARILQAIVTAADTRGIGIVTDQQDLRRLSDREQRRAAGAHLVLKTPRGIYTVLVREMPGPGGAKKEYRWGSRASGPAWLNNRAWEFISTGRLELIIDGEGTKYDGDRYRDAKKLTVEDKLPEVFRSLEIYRLRGEWQDQERQREAAERHTRWEAAMQQAHRRYEAHTRWEHFTQLSVGWHAARQHHEFLSAARRAADGLDEPLREQALTQLALVADQLHDSDPIQHPELLIPQISKPTPEDLKPYLGGWSPYGVDR